MIRIKSILLGLVLVVICGELRAQQVVNNGGNSIFKPSVQLQFSLGELQILNETKSDLNLVAGFNQGYSDESTASVRNRKEKVELSVFPNPSDHFVTVRSSDAVSCTIFAMDGRVMSTGSSSKNHSIVTESWPKGIYLIRLLTDSGETITKRLVKR
jgi:hypothetical protein